MPLGWTRGYAKAHGQFVYHGQPKEVYAYVIEPRLRQILLADPNQPLLPRTYLLAQCWFTDAYAERRKECQVPADLTFQTKPQLAGALWRTLWEAKLFPGQWVTCDASFGNNEEFWAQFPDSISVLSVPSVVLFREVSL